MPHTTSSLRKLVQEQGGIQLDIGCNAFKQPGFVGMDILDLPGVDILHDFNVYPWPLPDESVVRAMASHVVEHIPPVMVGEQGTWFPFMKFMDEVWRILRYDGEFAISTPYWQSQGYYQDPTHCNPCSEVTWAYFDPLEPNTRGQLYRGYMPKPWKLEHLSWTVNGNIEVILRKRRDDPSYHERISDPPDKGP